MRCVDSTPPNSLVMKTSLRLAALATIVLGLTFWFFGGCNLGWTKTSVPVEQVDPVTDLKYQVWEKRFVPGIDFVGATCLVAFVLASVSFLLPGKFGRQTEPH